MKNFSTLVICFLLMILIAAMSSCGTAEARRAESKNSNVVTTSNTVEVVDGKFEIKVKRRENADRVLYYDSTVTFIPTKEVQFRYTSSSEFRRK